MHLQNGKTDTNWDKTHSWTKKMEKMNLLNSEIRKNWDTVDWTKDECTLSIVCYCKCLWIMIQVNKRIMSRILWVNWGKRLFLWDQILLPVALQRNSGELSCSSKIFWCHRPLYSKGLGGPLSLSNSQSLSVPEGWFAYVFVYLQELFTYLTFMFFWFTGLHQTRTNDWTDALCLCPWSSSWAACLHRPHELSTKPL